MRGKTPSPNVKRQRKKIWKKGEKKLLLCEAKATATDKLATGSLIPVALATRQTVAIELRLGFEPKPPVDGVSISPSSRDGLCD